MSTNFYNYKINVYFYKFCSALVAICMDSYHLTFSCRFYISNFYDLKMNTHPIYTLKRRCLVAYLLTSLIHYNNYHVMTFVSLYAYVYTYNVHTMSMVIGP